MGRANTDTSRLYDSKPVLLNYILQVPPPPMERETSSLPSLAINKAIIYKNYICIPVPRGHMRPL